LRALKGGRTPGEEASREAVRSGKSLKHSEAQERIAAETECLGGASAKRKPSKTDPKGRKVREGAATNTSLLARWKYSEEHTNCMRGRA
jgi:hypothetical protein